MLIKFLNIQVGWHKLSISNVPTTINEGEINRMISRAIWYHPSFQFIYHELFKPQITLQMRSNAILLNYRLMTSDL